MRVHGMHWFSDRQRKRGYYIVSLKASDDIATRRMNRIIGATELTVFPIGLGAMPLAIRGRPDQRTAVRVIHDAIDAGIQLIDTANAYCIDQNDMGYNEQTIAAALRSVDSGDIVVATKGGLIRPGGRWERDGSPQSLRRACEKSLSDLEVDVVTLYQLHAPDPSVPFEDSVGELARLQSEGKIMHIGLSNVDARLLDIATGIAPIASVQNRCHAYCQADLNNGFVEYCRRKSITYIPYSPVGGGNGHVRLRDDRTLQRIAGAHGSTPYQVALAWLLAKSDNIIPIPGASRSQSIASSAGAVGLALKDSEISEIDALD